MSRLRNASPYGLASLLAVAGVNHFLSPGSYDALIPPFLPAPRAWIYVSGLLEMACAAAVAVPATRRRGALASAVLFGAVFPGNIYLAFEPGTLPRWLALARLPLQVPLVVWALQVARVAAPEPDDRPSAGVPGRA